MTRLGEMLESAILTPLVWLIFGWPCFILFPANGEEATDLTFFQVLENLLSNLVILHMFNHALPSVGLEIWSVIINWNYAF